MQTLSIFILFFVLFLSSCTNMNPVQVNSSPESTFQNLSVQKYFFLDSSEKIASEYFKEKGGLFSNSSIIGWGKDGKDEAIVFFRYDSFKKAFVCQKVHTENSPCECFKKFKKEIMNFLKQQSEKGFVKNPSLITD